MKENDFDGAAFFGGILKQYMYSRGLSIKDMVEGTGISQSWFSDVLNFKKNDISLSKACKIANFLNLKIDTFVFSNSYHEAKYLDFREIVSENKRLKKKLSLIKEVLANE